MYAITLLLGKLDNSSQHGAELGWLLNPAEKSVVIILPEQRIQLLTGSDILPALTNVALSLTVEQIFA